MIRIKLILLFLTLFSCSTLFSQQNNIRFKRLTINDGLSLSSVYCIYQDSKGFMWFGTEDGLNRYDGKKFTIYRSTPENLNCISYQWIEQIYEDSYGHLWLGSRGGLTKFNPESETFTQYRGVGENSQLANDTITQLYEDDHKRLWVGSLKGLSCIDTKNGELINMDLPSELKSRIYSFHKCNDGIWIGSSKGLFFYNCTNDKFEKLNLFNGKKEITSLLTHNQELWVGTKKGLYQIDSKTLKIQKSHLQNAEIESIKIDNLNQIWIVGSKALYRKPNNKSKFYKAVKSFEATNSLSTNTNKPILINKLGEVWFGTYGSGVFRIKPESNQKSNYKNNSADAQSLSQNSINCIYEDRNGIIWIGTFGAGISIYDPQTHKFSLLKNDPLDENSLASNFIWSVWEDHNQDLWIGTNDRGVSKYVVEKDSFIHYDIRKSIKESHPSIREVFEDSKGNIWLGTDGEGAVKVNPNNGSIDRFKTRANDSSSLSSNSVREFFEDSEGIIWIGTRDGLNKYDPKTKQFKQYKHIEGDENSLSNNFIYSTIYEDSKGLLWIGTYGGGLNIFDRKSEKFTNYQYEPGVENCLSNHIVFSIYEDQSGIYWIGTNDKLNRFNYETKTFTYFGTDDGLPNNVVYGVIPDSSNNIWLSTNNGICRFSLIDLSTKNFNVDDGLQSNEFNGGAFHIGNSGKLYFGGVYGLNIINPKLNFDTDRSYDAVFTKLEVNGQEVKVIKSENDNNENLVKYSEEKDEYSIPKSISYADNIQLEYENRFISLEFSSLASHSSNKIKYSYRLKGLEKKWVNSGNRNYVSYSNLFPDTYIFQVKTQNPNGDWNESIKELQIKIRSPFYMKWWFVIFEIFLLSIGIVFIYRFLLHARMNKLLTKQNERIRSTNIELQELNATKDKFFRIISHDLKNPFTSLLSISESIHENYEHLEEDEKQMGIRKVNESVVHIYDLLENLLTWSSSQTNKIDFHPSVFDISKLVNQSIVLYQTAAEKKELSIVSKTCDDCIVFADKNMCSSIIRNLLNNAIKFSKPNTTIEFNVLNQEKFVKIEIKDQGIGIDQENIKKLFRIDLKYKSTGTSGEKGTGLGLLLCKEFVDLNGGTIWVESSLGIGSSFFFTMPSKK